MMFVLNEAVHQTISNSFIIVIIIISSSIIVVVIVIIIADFRQNMLQFHS